MLIKTHSNQLHGTSQSIIYKQLSKHNFYNKLLVNKTKQLNKLKATSDSKRWSEPGLQFYTQHKKQPVLGQPAGAPGRAVAFFKAAQVDQNYVAATGCDPLANKSAAFVCNQFKTKTVNNACLTLVFSSVMIKDVIKAVQLVNQLLIHLSRWFITRHANNGHKQHHAQYGYSTVQNKSLRAKANGFLLHQGPAATIPAHDVSPLSTQNFVHAQASKQKQARVFSDFAQQFATKNIVKTIQKAPQSTSIFTVIRAAFVFKKTREQFGVTKNSYYITIAIQNKAQQNMLLQCLSLLKLVSEVKINICY